MLWQVEIKVPCFDQSYHDTQKAKRPANKRFYNQLQITESLQKPVVMQRLIAGAYISLSGINAHKDSNTIISVIFQTKDHNIERTILIIVKIT